MPQRGETGGLTPQKHAHFRWRRRRGALKLNALFLFNFYNHLLDGTVDTMVVVGAAMQLRKISISSLPP